MADNTLLIFSDDNVDSMVKAIDNALVMSEIVDNKIVAAGAEALDGPLSRVTINFINKKASPYVPDDYKERIQAAVTDVFNGDRVYKDAIENSLSVLDSVVEDLNEDEKINDVVTSLTKAAINLAQTAIFSVLGYSDEEEEEEEDDEE